MGSRTKRILPLLGQVSSFFAEHERIRSEASMRIFCCYQFV